MSETITNCPHCKEHCPLTNPGCGKGERFAREQRGETVVEEGIHRRERGEHGGHRHHAETDTLEGLFRACGHKLHHGGEEADAMFDALTSEERKYLEAILRKIMDQ